MHTAIFITADVWVVGFHFTSHIYQAFCLYKHNLVQMVNQWTGQLKRSSWLLLCSFVTETLWGRWISHCRFFRSFLLICETMSFHYGDIVLCEVVWVLGFLTRTQSQTRLQKILEDLFPSTENTQKFQAGKNTEQSSKGKKHRRSKTENLIQYQVGYSEKCGILA